MSTLWRRFLVVAALMFWQGGFTFYAAVVVPVAQGEIGHTSQGFITRRVTHYLNLAGAVSLAVFAWDAGVTHGYRGRRWQLRWWSWAGMAATLLGLIWLHDYLDGLLEPDSYGFLDRKAFRTGHRIYLWLSTFQWGFSLAYAGLALGLWRDEDRANDKNRSTGEELAG